MKANEYIAHLSHYLAALPDAERQKTLDYYREYLADLTEEGMDEAEAVATLPAPFALAGELLSNLESAPAAATATAAAATAVPSVTTVPSDTTVPSGTSVPSNAAVPVPNAAPTAEQAPATATAPQGGVSPLLIWLAILGFPLWFPILLTLCCIVLSILITIWTVLISLWSLVVCLFALTLLIPGSIVAFLTDGAITGLLCLGGGLSCLGLGLLSALGMGALTKYTAKFTAWSMKLMFGWMIPKKKKEVRA